MKLQHHIRLFWRVGFHPDHASRCELRFARRTAWKPSLQGATIAFLITLASGALAGTGTLDKASNWYPAGSNLTVTATPHVYSVFDGWQGDTNGASIATNTIQVSVESPMQISAVFSDKLTASNSVPYWWLDSVGITTNFEVAVTNDPDGDGFTTAQEYWSGTDPQTNASYLHIAGVETTATNFRLILAHQKVDAGNIPDIAVQHRSSMTAGSWTNVGAYPPANGTNFWSAPGQQGAFYRLAVTNMP